MRSRGRRIVVFWQRLIPHAFDPNRIFTDAGLRETLSDYSSLTASALAALQLLRGEVLNLLRPPHGQPVVELHNNDGIGYSVVEYLAGGRHTDDAAAVAAPAMQRPEDFFLVTDPRWFARLEVPGFNVVIQSPMACDDGSLSVWFQQQAISYINVEALHGRLAEQEDMKQSPADGKPRYRACRPLRDDVTRGAAARRCLHSAHPEVSRFQPAPSPCGVKGADQRPSCDRRVTSVSTR